MTDANHPPTAKRTDRGPGVGYGQMKRWVQAAEWATRVVFTIK